VKDKNMTVSIIMDNRTDEDAGSQEPDLAERYSRKPSLHTVTDNQEWSIDRINARLNDLQLPHEVNEPLIEGLLQQIDHCAHGSQARSWLLTARVLEAALVGTGHYVDNCEFGAAGDLLANPRQVLIHLRGYRQPIVKKRHGRLSEQLAPYCRYHPFPAWFKDNAALEIAKPALVPDLLQRLERSRCFRPAYLDSIHRRMNKAADTIGFLSAWGLTGWEDMYQRLQAASRQQQEFIADNLCGFDLEDYHGLGREIDLRAGAAGIQSRYLLT
jgi:hypothetical protein